MRKLQVYSVAFVAALGLAACGDDDSDFSALPEKQPDNAVTSIDDLSNCTSKKEGNLEFVKDTPYVCAESDGKYKWIQVSQTEDEPEDFKVCNQKREGQYALASKEDILYACSDEEWIPVESGDVSSSSGKEANSSSSKPKSSDSGKDVESSGSESSSSAKDASSNSESSSSGKSSSSGPSTSSGTFEQSSSSSVSSSSAVSSSGTSSSEVRSSSSTPSSFSVGDDRSVYDAKNNTLTDYRDGQVYRTVSIDKQTWMAENLNYAYTGVPFICIDYLMKYTSDSASWCYGNDASNCAKYGRLYSWAAAVGRTDEECGREQSCNLPSGNIRGVCPSGWHLPKKEEWEALFTAVDDQSTAGKLLKSTSGWKYYYDGADVYGFSALPAGVRDPDGDYAQEGYFASFWSSTKYGLYDAYSVSLINNLDNADLWYYSKGFGYSVRCLMD